MTDAHDPFGSTNITPADGDVFDFNEDQEFAFDVPVETNRFFVPAGVYPAVLVLVTKDTSKSGNPMLVWEYELRFTDRLPFNIKNHTVLTENAAWKLRETLNALGIPNKPGERATFRVSQVIGKAVLLTLEEGEYQGRPRNNVSMVSAWDASMGTAPTLAPANEDSPF